MEVNPIGVIHSPFHTKDSCPIQPTDPAQGRVEVFPEYAAGLKDIEAFSHVYLMYLFDRAGEIQLVRPTFLDDTPHGVFATRHPCRPNGIGLSNRPNPVESRTLLAVAVRFAGTPGKGAGNMSCDPRSATRETRTSSINPVKVVNPLMLVVLDP